VEILGLAKSSRTLCADFATQQKISVTFDEADVISAPPAAVSLCLYRILQEALHNVAKHSGARAFAVELRGTAADIRLVVQDDGRGFDAAAAASHGIGLASMHERIELVGGGLTVESAPERGTRIEARVPIAWPRPA
jgi:signal transduction histidine kinase